MKAIIWTGALAVFIAVYSCVLVFTVAHRTQQRIDKVVAKERAVCESRIDAVKAQYAPVQAAAQDEGPSAAEPDADGQTPGQTQVQTAPAQNSAENTPAAQPAPAAAQPPVQVSFEARAAARAKYVEGLNYFNHDDYPAARQLWLDAVQLDPTNVEAQMGLTKVEELLKG